MIDDQSDQCLALSEFFNQFGENGAEMTYSLETCAGKFNTSGRLGTGYAIQSLDGEHTLRLPTILECNDIPQNKNEIPSPDILHHYDHLCDLVDSIPPIALGHPTTINNACNIELLIGRDLVESHFILEHRIGKPYAQKLPLGWVIIGNVCLDKTHATSKVNVNKTAILPIGRPTILEPCENAFAVKSDHFFNRSSHDEKPGLSIEDRKFIDIMDSGFTMSDEGKWTAPLPFRYPRPTLDNNRSLAMKRALSFDKNLQFNETKAAHVVEFMTKIFERGHAEIAPEVPPNKEIWYLPLFGVYHPKKPENVRVVFDSSAKFHGTSLNDVLLTGPDLCNSLLGILLRFRKEKVGVTVDVEQMFHNFKVNTDHRDYLRFLWHENNDLSKPLVDHRMTVHTFGNGPSPAVATYGMRKSVQNADPDVQEFICRNFYVDDGLISCASPEEAISLVKRSQRTLKENGDLRLHKVVSNCRDVLDAFSQDDLAKNLKELDFGNETLPVQRSLGLLWDTEGDFFTFKTAVDDKPFTRRGVLSVINSIYDPIGFVAPVVITGRLMMRELMLLTKNTDWDEPLPPLLRDLWNKWVNSLRDLEHVHIDRQYLGTS
ncbi:hypothetical protein FSP39_000384 [Pinctada imbricata]|uniref:Reverse transcriptase domain-containing protein n=1 Tax=Pinctada imbricata TaxID=66713 RepID=A0AA89BKA5_PINIB|nr:hypothetical protein FSP39_000384 [Pinctada imbricata]